MSSDKTLEKIPTHIPGLDDILHGGIPKGRVTAFGGGPGAGKSVFSLELVANNAKSGIPTLFFSFEQSKDDILVDARSFGWPVDDLLQSEMLSVESSNLDHVETAGDVDILSGLLVLITAAVKTKGVSVVVLDALDILLDMLPAPEHLRQLRYFTASLRKLGVTVVLTVKKDKNRLRDIDFLVDCVVQLDQRVDEQVTMRRLRVSKYRGSDNGRNEYPFVITSKGITVIPITQIGLQHKGLGEFLTTGIPRFDRMLGGGIRKNSCILLAGTPGTAKTTLAATFAQHRCDLGERVLTIDLEQSTDAYLNNISAAGIDLTSKIDEGSYLHTSHMPESAGSEEHLIRAYGLIESHKPDHVIVDAISACARMGSGRAAYEYAFRLMDHCKSRGITTLLLNQTDTFMDLSTLSGTEISSMVDTAIALNFVQSGAELNRVALILKSRGAANSNQFREFAVTDEGIKILDVCLEMDGKLLTGTARQAAEERTNAKRTVKLNRKRQLEKELEEIRLDLETEDSGRRERGSMRSKNLSDK